MKTAEYEKEIRHVAIVSAEFTGLAQRGGLGDVVRDLSTSLARRYKQVSVILPYYDVITHACRPVTTLQVGFADKVRSVEVYNIEFQGVTIYLLRNEFFSGSQYGDVYVDSGKFGRGPFEDDAKRFAFFATAALEYLSLLNQTQPIQVLHGHDWHTGTMFLSLKYDPRYRQLQRDIRTIFTIHNLEYQGVRPLESAPGSELAAFADWFPHLYGVLRKYRHLGQFTDPAIEKPCFNFMRTAIRLADNLNTVSPSYAREILKTDDAETAFLGGRGLEKDLRRAFRRGRLHGILNGIDYDVFNPSQMTPAYSADSADFSVKKSRHKAGLLAVLQKKIHDMPNLANRSGLLEKIASIRSADWLQKPLLVMVSRMATQKMSLLMEPYRSPQQTITDHLLQKDVNAVFLGRGEHEHAMSETVNRHQNGVMIPGFDGELEKYLYSAGDIFLMPSDFEPCGVSQMKAMRFGCLPVVHHVGGLKDTVVNEKTGFVFRGAERNLRKEKFITAVDKAVHTFSNRSTKWRGMQKTAMERRFDWGSSTGKYQDLYQATPTSAA